MPSHLRVLHDVDRVFPARGHESGEAANTRSRWLSARGCLVGQGDMNTPNTPEAEARAQSCVVKYTLAAAGTGAIPLPGASLAIIAENAIMVGHVSAAMGQPVTLESVAISFGAVAALNVGLRTVFVEGMRAINAAAFGGLGAPLVCALGASTAALQTWMLGHLAIAIAKNGGTPLGKGPAGKVIDAAKRTFDLDALRAKSKKKK